MIIQQPTNFLLTPEQIFQYQKDGFVIVKGLFQREELEPIINAYDQESEINEQETEFADVKGNLARIAHWTELGDSLLGVIPRLNRIVDNAELLLSDECYHWHSKLVRKRPHDQSCFGWHQLYGGVYTAGCLFPNLSACFIAVRKIPKPMAV